MCGANNLESGGDLGKSQNLFSNSYLGRVPRANRETNGSCVFLVPDVPVSSPEGSDRPLENMQVRVSKPSRLSKV